MTRSHLWFEQARLTEGWAHKVRLTIDGGRISAITTGTMPESTDERHAIGLAGMPNLHSHAFQRVIAGLTERRGPDTDSFWSWRDQMYRLQGRIGPDELQAIAALAYMEMLEAGFTRVGEFHYLHHDQNGHAFADPAQMSAMICAAADQTGMGLTLLPVFYAHSGFGGQVPTTGQARFIHDISGFARLLEGARRHAAHLPDAVIGIAPHSLRAVTGDELTALIPLAEGAPIHIHIAEQIREVDDCVAHSGQRPVEWLLNHVTVDAQWCLVHATHMTEDETLRLARSKAVAGLCPITEANLGDGIFSAADYLSHGGRFGIGSDSNVQISMAEELRMLEYPQRLHHRARNVLAAAGGSTGERLFSGALTGGSQALGVSAGIAVGHSADIVSLNSHHPSLVAKGGADVIDSLIFATSTGAIDCVWRQGRKWVSGGRHAARDIITGDYARLMKRLLS
ncbi:formimidoylglutamate deiminase [Asticcacaulis machinosus]|uniref:Formimidoylglutamate deiminase n=1 Tax=Asticcacaulis machinosus TaxID=2984211 RepID=A0ABT5HNH9_9CAUL|nr:formimidoylglutamate deiminase [Asticcacaulis machinosus]MDC7677788.1 formimidoylglutamate deiminase [Asticcacaulis machinosus]